MPQSNDSREWAALLTKRVIKASVINLAIGALLGILLVQILDGLGAYEGMKEKPGVARWQLMLLILCCAVSGLIFAKISSRIVDTGGIVHHIPIIIGAGIAMVMLRNLGVDAEGQVVESWLGWLSFGTCMAIAFLWSLVES